MQRFAEEKQRAFCMYFSAFSLHLCTSASKWVALQTVSEHRAAGDREWGAHTAARLRSSTFTTISTKNEMPSKMNASVTASSKSRSKPR